MAKIKLLILVTQSVWGGAQKYVYDLATNLPSSYNVTVGAGSGGELLPKLKKAGIKTWEIPELVRSINPVKDLQALIKIYRKIKGEKFDLVHANSSKAGVLGRVSAKLAGVPSTYTVHGLVLNERLNPIYFAIYFLMEWLGGICSEKIITVSRFDKESVVRYGMKNSKDVVVVHNGIGKLSFKVQPHEDIVVGTIANFYETKGYKYYLPAIKKVLSVYPKTKFKIVGTGPLKDWVTQEVKNIGLEKSVEIITDNTDAWQRLSGFDIFILPSIKEGLPYTITEAMQAGLPVVATKVGGVPEQVEDGKTGFIVPPADSVALAQALIKLLKNSSLRSRMGVAGKDKALSAFSLQDMVKNTNSLYQSILR